MNDHVVIRMDGVTALAESVTQGYLNLLKMLLENHTLTYDDVQRIAAQTPGLSVEISNA